MVGTTSAIGTVDDGLTALRRACDDVRQASETDAVDGVHPQVVARPSSTAEVAAVMRAAAAHRLTVVPRGRGTKMTWGSPPHRVDLVVDLSRMDRVLDHAAGDLVLVVQPGATLDAVAQVTAQAGQRLAIDRTVAGASVGGSIATATSGPTRVLVGTVRDLLIGITVVRADGVVAKAGGRVVKNVAGYDVGKLITGSFGTLGIITEATFRLHPLPAATKVVSVEVGDHAEAHRLVQAVMHSQVVPSAVELDWPAEGPGRLAVLLEGIAAGVERRAATTRQLLGATRAKAGDELPGWWGTSPWGAGETGLKLAFALTGLPHVLNEARAAAAEHGLALGVRGSAGAGVLHATLPADATPAAVAAVLARVRATCTRHGGSVVVVDAPAEIKRSVDLWGPVSAVDLMRRVKQQFDPEYRLSPGRFVGGI
jgi:glycolate oxidase FAD binding subunit